MIQAEKKTSPNEMILFVSVLINVVVLEHAFTINEQWYWALIVTLPTIIFAGIYNKKSKNVHNGSL